MMRDESRIAAIDPEALSLEGYLFPDTDQFPRSAGAKGIGDACRSAARAHCVPGPRVDGGGNPA